MSSDCGPASLPWPELGGRGGRAAAAAAAAAHGWAGFNAAPAVLFLYEYQWLPPLLALVYLTFCFAGPRVMANRK